MPITHSEVQAIYIEIKRAKDEGREPDFSGFSEEALDHVEKDPVSRTTIWGQQLEPTFRVDKVETILTKEGQVDGEKVVDQEEK